VYMARATGPWDGELRPGDNKYSSSILARRSRYGRAPVGRCKVNARTMSGTTTRSTRASSPICRSTARCAKVLVHFDRNGFAYTIDRATGEVLVAQSYVPMNWASGVDLATGRPRVNADKVTRIGKTVTNICPSLEGGKNQQPAAFSPVTGLFYVPTNNCAWTSRAARDLHRGHPVFQPSGRRRKPGGPGGYRGEFMAWDATTGRKVWGIREPFPVWSGALATAGNVVFYGTLDGWFKAADARTGEPLWQFKVSSGVVGNPMTYRGPDGKQYVRGLRGDRRRHGRADRRRCAASDAALRRSRARDDAAGSGTAHEFRGDAVSWFEREIVVSG